MKKTWIGVFLAMTSITIACDETSDDQPMRDVTVEIDADSDLVILADEDGNVMDTEQTRAVFFDVEGRALTLPQGDDADRSYGNASFDLMEESDTTEICCYGCVINGGVVSCKSCDPNAACAQE